MNGEKKSRDLATAPLDAEARSAFDYLKANVPGGWNFSEWTRSALIREAERLGWRREA